MATANLFTVSSFGSFFLFPLFITHHGGSKADIGIIMGALPFASILCRPWVSEMIDRVGRKRSYTIGCLIMTLLPLTYLLFHGDLSCFYLPLIFVRLLHGVGLAICFTATFTYIADIVPDERLNEGIGMFGTTGLTGLAMGPVIAEVIIKGFGFSTFFLAAAGLGAIGLLLQLLLPESYMSASHESAQSFFTVLLKDRIMTVASLALLFGFGLAAAGSFVSPLAKERHLAFVSLYFVSYSFAAVLTRVLGGRIADKVGEEHVVPYALILVGAGILALIFTRGIGVLVLSGLMSGCGHGFLFPCLNALAIRNEPISIRGKITGVFTGGIDAGAFVGSTTLGYIGEWAGFNILFLFAGLVVLSGLGVFRLHVIRNR